MKLWRRHVELFADVYEHPTTSCRFLPTVPSQLIGSTLGPDPSRSGTTTRSDTLEEVGAQLRKR